MTVAKRLISESRRGDAIGLDEGLDLFKKCAHAHLIKCDITHRQGVIFPGSLSDAGLCHITPMAEPFDMDAVRAAVQRHMDRRNIKRKPLAQQAGLGETSIRDLFNPERKSVRADTLVKLAEYFETTVDELSGRDPIPLLGNIGAGGQILFLEVDDPEFMPRPAFTPGKLMALRVVGDSMLPRYDDGDVIYVRRDHEGVLPEYLGNYCAVHTVEGGTYLKILSPGSTEGRFTLRSLNAADMENVEVVWASPVEGVLPRRALEKWKERQ